ncbi:SpoIIE family protein phosphatase [Streptomyces sp. B1866]|uniref:SpoIIE family protein phosphatase n=1 Tax=Streptomyces sp. B1866 TaxID=3075431 RepID=UPI00289231AF|nr:SpoIIE family protein phosphatase [Streptomyces sp. B1866]MDT3396454.1 SpoIIE family protein phosphatase [Streptomyces sp. B1866]
MREPAAADSGPRQLDPLLDQAMRESGASVGTVYLLPPGEQVLRLTELTGIPVEFAAPWLRVALSAPDPLADAVRERRLVWIGSQEEMARAYPRTALAVPYPFALAAAPILSGDACYGGVVLLWPGSHRPEMTPREGQSVAAACRRIAATLRQAEEEGHPVLPGPEPLVLDPPRSRTPEWNEALAAVDFVDRLPEGGWGLDQEGRISFASAGAAELVGRSVPDLLGSPPWEALPWLKDPVFEDRYRAAVISHQPTSFTAMCPPDRWLSFQLYPDVSGVSVRITPVPLAHPAAHPTPALHGPAALAGPPRGRTPPGRTALSPGASPEGAAPAPGRAGPRAAEPPAGPARAGALYLLTHLAATLTEAVGVRDVVEQVAEQVTPAFEAQGFILFLGEGRRLRIVGHRGYSPEAVDLLDGFSLHTAQPTPATLALTVGLFSFYGSPEELERAYPMGIPEVTGKSAWAFLPLIASGQPVGVCVLSYEEPREFDPDERTAMTAVAGLIAQALARARLYDTKHELAHGLQAGLLPTALPEVPGLGVVARYLPATRDMDIGGDFYDLIRLGDASAAATIGDVQGHNVTAAALMGQVRTAVHATAGAAPGAVLSRTNHLLTDLDPGLFTSCLYVDLDLRARRARLATAGHPPPLLCRPDGRTEPVPLRPGLLLGIDLTADYPTTEIPLPPGAILALYTDGLVERPGVDLDEATAALARALSEARHQPLDTLADTLISHASHTDSRSDDIALLLLRAEPEGADGPDGG